MLRLVSTDIHNDEVSLTANEFNSLRILFKVKNQDGNSSKAQPSLAQLTPFFTQSGQSIKIHINMLQEWLLGSVAQTEEDLSASQSRNFTSQQSQLDQPDYIAFLNKCMTVRDVTNTASGKDIRVISCEDSYIYIGIDVDCLQITKCVNCTIFLAAASRCVTLERCENVTLCCASTYLRIGNCVDCIVNSYTQLAPPVIFGDTRSLMLAPHNASYPELENSLKAAGINYKSHENYEDRLSYFSRALLMRVSAQSVNL